MSVPVSAEVPNDAVSYNGHSYKVIDVGKVWPEAKQYYESLGGHLATVTSDGEQTLITELISKGGRKNFWIGGFRNSDGNWEWVTGERFSYTHWAPNQPDNSYENAIMLYTYNPGGSGNDMLGYWNDLNESGTWGSDSRLGLDNFGMVCEWESASTSSSTADPYSNYTGEGTKPLTKDETTVKNEITTSKKEEIAGSSYPLLQARATKVKTTPFTLKWNKLTGATKYIIYGNRCGTKNRFEFIKETTKNYYKPKKLKAGKFYKYLVVAVKDKKVISVSKTVHVGLNPRPNPTKVKVNKKKVTLTTGSVGNTFQITYKIKGTTLKQHRGIRCETDNVNVAKVTNKGKIRAVGIGNCNVYVYAQNGVCAKIAVTVVG